MTQTWIESANWSVCVTVQAPHVWARLYVNNRETATLTAWKGKTEAGARRWAERILATREAS